MGVKGVTLAHDNDEVIGMVVIDDQESDIMVVSEKGYGKRSAVEDYRITNRGGKGVKTISVTEKTGDLIAILNVNDENDLMIINKSGITIRMRVDEMRTMGRATQGVRLISLKGKDEIAAVCKVLREEEEDIEDQDAELIEGAENAGDAPAAEGEAPAEDAPTTEE
jgi:DNA gyrase subunit A